MAALAETRNLISIEEALRLVLERVRRLPEESSGIEGAFGRVLANDAVSAVDLPPFDSSAMDGFAFRSSDTPGRLPVVHRIPAGTPAPRSLEAGEAMGIATGAVVPGGADAVIPFEDVVESDNTIEIEHPVERGANVRPTGGDISAGETVVEAGARLEARHLAALAAAGIPEVRVARRPRAAVVVTGSELRRPGEALAPGQIYEANGILLEAQLVSAGANVERASSVADEEAAHREALERGLDADVLVTSGGVSVGPHDLVRATLAELGVEEVFWGVSVKPGKPISFGVAGDRLVFGLPGNPVSVLVGFELFVRPALLALQGSADPGPRFERGVLSAQLMRNPVRDELVRARVQRRSEGPVVKPLAGRESHMIVRAAGADALVLVPRGNGDLDAGEAVEFLRI
jgi:molybdopterin molybdotransferase